MSYYSFIAVARVECGIKDPLILLGPGENVFTAHTNDLDALLRQLAELGVRVKRVMDLAANEPVPVEENLYLPQERAQLTSGDR